LDFSQFFHHVYDPELVRVYVWLLHVPEHNVALHIRSINSPSPNDSEKTITKNIHKQTIEIVQCLIPISHVNKMINVLIFIALKISDSERYTMDF